MKEKLTIKDICRKRFEPVKEEIERLLQSDKMPILVAIDGHAASGKTTLGYYLAEMFECNLFHMDDFFLQNDQRTEERLNEVGGNVDYERFQKEVLASILKRENVGYRPFSCKTRTILETKEIPFKRLNIIEGSYSQHPYFGGVFDLKVFTEIAEEEQMERIRQRNGEAMLERFVSEWIPKENAYFEKFKIKEASLIIQNY